MDAFEEGQDGDLFKDEDGGEEGGSDYIESDAEELDKDASMKAAKSLSALLLPLVNHPGSLKYRRDVTGPEHFLLKL